MGIVFANNKPCGLNNKFVYVAFDLTDEPKLLGSVTASLRYDIQTTGNSFQLTKVPSLWTQAKQDLLVIKQLLYISKSPEMIIHYVKQVLIVLVAHQMEFFNEYRQVLYWAQSAKANFNGIADIVSRIEQKLG